MNSCIYIDDTASAGQPTESAYLTEDRRTWVAVFFTAEERAEAFEQLQGCIEFIAEQFGADEFHFTDIYSGTKDFKNVNIDIRLNIFKAFVDIYNVYKWKMIVQTVNNRTLQEHGIKVKNLKASGFNFADNDDIALLMLLVSCKLFAEGHTDTYKLPIDIVIDAGRQKPGTTQKVEFLSGISPNSSVIYNSSNIDILIQIADFLAFSVNKLQMIAVKKTKSRVDKEFLRIMSVWEPNCDELLKVKINLNDSDVATYDKNIRVDKDMKGIIGDNAYENIKHILAELEKER